MSLKCKHKGIQCIQCSVALVRNGLITVWTTTWILLSLGFIMLSFVFIFTTFLMVKALARDVYKYDTIKSHGCRQLTLFFYFVICCWVRCGFFSGFENVFISDVWTLFNSWQMFNQFDEISYFLFMFSF